MIIAAFPQSAAKIIIQDEFESSDPVFCWEPVLKETVDKKLKNTPSIKEVYVFGPKIYIKKIVEDIKSITELPVIEEGM